MRLWEEILLLLIWIEGEERVGERKKEIKVGGRVWTIPAAVLWGETLHCTATNLTGNGASQTPRANRI